MLTGGRILRYAEALVSCLQLDKNQSEEDPLPTPMEERKQVSPVYFLPSSPMALAQSLLFESFPRVEDQVRLSGYSQSLFRPPRS